MRGMCFLSTDVKKEEGLSIKNVLTNLKHRAATCKYEQLENSMIRDQIVLNVSELTL